MLKLTNVSKYYHSNDVVALGLRKVNLEFKLGEFVAVTGESGSGKSTLLNVISGLDTYEDGEMYVNGEETSYFTVEDWEGFRRQYIGFVFQNYNIIDSYSVLENVMIALIIQGYDQETRKERALELIDRVGLTSHVHHKASKLSGGQKQRCVIARALAKDCPIIVADEPTGNLDSESGKIIMELLQEISHDKLVILVTHNYDQVSDYATRKIRLFDGEVVEDKAIKKPAEIEVKSTIPSFTMSFLNLIGIALRNAFRTPRRTIFTTIVAIFTTIVFVFAYTTYEKVKIESGDFGGGGYFRNVTDQRIIVTKFDNTPFTDLDIGGIENIRKVRTVLEHDVIMDSVMFYYTYEYGYFNGRGIYVNPAAMLENKDLIKGSLPTSEFEIVIEEIEGYDVGDTINLGYTSYMEDSNGSANPFGTEFTISGITSTKKLSDWYGRMYFHEDYLDNSELLINSYLGGDYYGSVIELQVLYNGVPALYLYGGNIIIDDSIADNEVEVQEEMVNEMLWNLGLDPENGFTELDGFVFQLIGDSAFENNVVDIEITGMFESVDGRWSAIAMNEDTLNEFLPSAVYQMSVLVEDLYDANRVIDDLDALGYNTIYPEAISDPFSAIGAIFITITFGFILGLLVLVIYLISYLVLKNIQNSKKKDYLIFRSIGASKRDLNRVTIIELIFTTLLAYIITFSLLVVNERNNTALGQYLRYFTVYSYIFILVLLVALSLLLGRRFNKRIFSKSVITSLKQE